MAGAGARAAARLAMVVVLAAIGIGSYLFHTHAQVWSAMADVIPILLFILLYVFAATRDFLGMANVGRRSASRSLFVPYAAAMTARCSRCLPPLRRSRRLLAGADPDRRLRLRLARPAPETARGPGDRGRHPRRRRSCFGPIDEAVCPAVPVGHALPVARPERVMLGWMIVVLLRHAAAAAPPGTRGGRALAATGAGG